MHDAPDCLEASLMLKRCSGLDTCLPRKSEKPCMEPHLWEALLEVHCYAKLKVSFSVDILS